MDYYVKVHGYLSFKRLLSFKFQFIISNINLFFLISAFSWFALCEYVIAGANMMFHITVILDFPTENIIVANAFPPATAKKLE